MNITSRLISLYPRAFRRRWGDAVETEARAAGARSWPHLAHGIIDMWLHPALWPADTRAQRHARASVLATAVAAACWYLAHLIAETDGALPTLATRSWAMSTCAALMVIGLVLVAPRPRLTPAAVATILRHVLRRMFLPALLGAGVVTWARADLPVTSPLLRLALLSCWYGSLAAAAIQACRIVADLGATLAEPPPPWRLRLGMWTIAAASTTTGSIILTAALTTPTPDTLSALVGAAVLALALAPIATIRDLRHLAIAR